MTDHDHEPGAGPNGPGAPDERTAPVTGSREHGSDREPLTRSTESETGDDGFVWCETVSTPDPTGGGFEWCEPVGDEKRASTASDDTGTDSEVETDPETQTGTGTDAEGEQYSLPRGLVTTTRMTGADDEAVALLSALRRDPDGGRWRRAVTELDDE